MRTVLISGAGLLFFLLWVASIAITYWDISRRKLAPPDRVAWLALPVLLPLAGFAAYLITRWIDRRNGAWQPPAAVVAQPAPQVASQGALTQAPQPPDLPTIAAADLEYPTGAHPVEVAPPASIPAEAPGLRLCIRVVSGPCAGMEFFPENLPAGIGRGPQAAVRLEADEHVSRQQAEFYCQGERLYLRDLNSTHGTFVNGQRIEDHPLQPGEPLQVGLSVLHWSWEERGEP